MRLLLLLSLCDPFLQEAVAQDTWLPEWTDDPKLACSRWADDATWGALQGGRNLMKSLRNL